jgi:signal transduction histidine kinase/DNA-binding response OmpR family regulator
MRIFPQLFRSVSLQKLLLLTTLGQILAAASLVGYLSFKNSQESVEDLANQLISTTNYRVQNEIENYLALPVTINQLNADAVKTGLLSLNDPQAIEDRLWNQFQSFKSTSYIYISSMEGGIIAVGQDPDGKLLKETSNRYPKSGDYRVFKVDQQGKRTSLLQVIDTLDARTRPWFKQPVAAKKPVWVEPFYYVNRESIISISASSPLYDGAGRLQGVATVDLNLDRLSDFLHAITPEQQSQIFIMERSGKLLASSEQNPIITIRGRAEIIQARKSPNRLIRESVQQLESQFKTLADVQEHRATLKIEGEPYFVQVNPWKDEIGLDWLVVVVVPKSQFMGQIQIHNQITVGLLLLLAALATALANVIARRISAPLSQLSTASQTLAEASRQNFAGSQKDDRIGSQINPILTTSNIQEIKTLALNFERMREQLQDSYTELESYSHVLETKVKERTQSLEAEISIRKQAEAQSLKAKEAAEIASQVKSEFLTNMSHELRSPLNAILGFAQLMQRSNRLTDEHRDYATIINRSGEHLLSLINGVLDMSKIEAGRMAYRPTAFDLYRLLDDVRNMFQLRAAEKQISFDFHYAPNLPPYIVSDQGKLRQVLINLLNNAIKFTKVGGVTLQASLEKPLLAQATDNSQTDNLSFQKAAFFEPSVVSDPANVTLYFEIKDTGHGIASDDLKQVFEPFFQTHLGQNTPEGTGLGLSISQKFVQIMGGDLKLNSAGIEKGTTAIFSIQAKILQNVEVKAHKPNQRVIALAPNQTKYRLLIVDDKSENRKLLVTLLQPLGFDLKEASNGQSALKIATQWQPHLIWMDMRMPILDGYKATQQIRQLPTTLAPKVIALSASSFREEEINARAAGCDDFIHKPFHPDDIFEALSRHLGVRYLYDESTIAANPLVDSSIHDGGGQKADLSHGPINGLTHGLTHGLIDPNRLSALSPQLLEDLESATRRIQWDRLLQMIEQIRSQDEALAEALTITVHRFHYAHILQAIQAVKPLEYLSLHSAEAAPEQPLTSERINPEVNS